MPLILGKSSGSKYKTTTDKAGNTVLDTGRSSGSSSSGSSSSSSSSSDPKSVNYKPPTTTQTTSKGSQTMPGSTKTYDQVAQELGHASFDAMQAAMGTGSSSGSASGTSGTSSGETSGGTSGDSSTVVARIPVETSSGTEYLSLTQKHVNTIWAKDPGKAQDLGLPPSTETGDTVVQEQPEDDIPEPRTDPETGLPIETDNSPVFTGDETLVTLAGSDVVFLVNRTDKTVRPFSGMEALKAVFGDNADAAYAIAQSQEVSEKEFGPFGIFEGYNLLDDPQYAIQPDGSALKYDDSAEALGARYGQEIDVENEGKAFMALNGFLTQLSNDSTSGIDPNTIRGIKDDEKTIAKYLNAVTYGGYGLADIWRDLKKQELLKAGGNSDLSNIEPISTKEKRVDYQASDEGKNAYDNLKLSPPSDIVGLTLDILNLPIYNMPQEAFRTLSPVLLDPTSDEFKAKMDEVQSAFHDVIMQQLEANTEQQKAIADYNWSKFKEEVERTYGLKLADNAYEAWNQLEGARDQFAQRGIEGSGLQAESMDDYLRRVRTLDERQRHEQLVEEEREEAKFYLSFATPAEINAFVQSDPEKAKRLGITPSDEIMNNLSFSALKAKYPDMSDEEIQRNISRVLDENGNYRSSLYQGYIDNKLAEEDRFTKYQTDMVFAKALEAENDAYKQYTTPDSPFLRNDEDAAVNTDNAIKLDFPSSMQIKQQYENLGTPGEIQKESTYGPKGSFGSEDRVDQGAIDDAVDQMRNKEPTYPSTPPKTSISPNTSNMYTLTNPDGTTRDITKAQADSYSQGANSLAPGFKVAPKSTTGTTGTSSKTSSYSKMYDPSGKEITGLNVSAWSPETLETAKKKGYTFI